MAHPLTTRATYSAEVAVLTQSEFPTIPPTEENVSRCDALLQRLLITFQGVENLLNIPVPWIKLIQALKIKKPKVCIGVIGATGEGKSSLINAVLDEVKLIPTSCMRACTSAATEISYNESPGPSHQSQVDFITADEWRQELMILLGDLQGDRVSLKDSKSPAAIALSKITAVYPYLDTSQLGPAAIDDLMSLPAVSNVLGTIKYLEATSGTDLHDKITDYIDSREEGIEASEKMQLWPLIRKFAIKTRALALKYGTVIVDLPGLLDSNAARASIAQNYLQTCDVMWYVANINRARDNATAKSFFENELKRQLHLDGTISRLSFICTKTDNIKLSEVRDAFKKSADACTELRQIELYIEQTEAMIVEIDASLGAANLSLQEVSNSVDELEIQLTELKKLKKRAKNGEAVWPLKAIRGNPRKRGSETNIEERAPKRTAIGPPRTVMHSQNTYCRRRTPTKGQSVRFEEDKLQPQLSFSDVEELIEDRDEELAELRSDKRERHEELNDLRDQRETAVRKKDDLLSEDWQTCVALRNKQVTMLIRQKFAEDINEFYVKKEQEKDDFDPINHIYMEGDQAKELPVYCISARGYEELSNWQVGKKRTEFANFQQTQIPLLVEHAQRLGKASQNAEAEKHILSVRGLLISIKLWSNGCRKSHTAGLHAVFNDASQMALVDRFWTETLELVRRTFDQVKNITQTRVLNILASAGRHGASQAPTTAKTWRENAWNTYQAACRHRGHFVSSNGRTVEFNNDLTAPFMDYIAAHWARLFNQTLISIFNGATIQGNKAVVQFKEEFVQMMETYGCMPDDMATFHERLSLFLRSVDRILKAASAKIQEKQRGYGSGMYKRMKDLMEDSIDRKKDEMFRNVIGTVDLNIAGVLKEVTEDSLHELADSWYAFRRDCAQFLATKPTDFTTYPVNAQFEIRQVLKEADQLFGGRTGQPVRLLAAHAENVEESCMFFPES